MTGAAWRGKLESNNSTMQLFSSFRVSIELPARVNKISRSADMRRASSGASFPHMAGSRTSRIIAESSASRERITDSCARSSRFSRSMKFFASIISRIQTMAGCSGRARPPRSVNLLTYRAIKSIFFINFYKFIQTEDIMRLSIPSLADMKRTKQKITMLTAYDFSFAPILDAAGIDIILVGDSMANVVLGMESTTEISLDEMINHSRAVVKGIRTRDGDRRHALLLLPGATRKTRWQVPAASSKKPGARAVKLEWFDHALEVNRAYRERRHPGHGPHRLHAADGRQAGQLDRPGQGLRHGKAPHRAGEGRLRRPAASASSWNACPGRSPEIITGS